MGGYVRFATCHQALGKNSLPRSAAGQPHSSGMKLQTACENAVRQKHMGIRGWLQGPLSGVSFAGHMDQPKPKSLGDHARVTQPKGGHRRA